MSIIEPRLLETFHSSLIVTVTKRKIVEKYKEVFDERGYIIQDLNFVKPMDSNIAYDPMQFVSSYSDITFLAESIVLANPKKEKSTSDPYWDECAISLLSAEISMILMTKNNPTFSDVLELNDRLSIRDGNSGLISTTLDKDFEELAKKDPNCFAVTCWKSFKMLPMKTAGCVYGTLNTTIDTIFSPELRKMISRKKKISFEEIAKQKTVLFVSTSAVNPTLNCFINMFYGQMFKQLFEYAENRPSGQLPIPVSVLCDDFATGSRVINFAEYISIFREKGISVTLLLQSESQLESMYGSDDCTTIINNCDTYIFLGGMDLTTGRHISERLNSPLEDVLYIPIGQEILFRRGQKPIICKRYNILENELYQKISRDYEEKIRRAEMYERM